MAFLFNMGGTGTSITIYRGLNVQSSCQGVGIAVAWGRVRVSGNMLWYGDFKTHAESQGGKGGGSATSYSYSACFVIGLLQTGPLGPIAKVREVWDGQSVISLVVDASDGTPKGGGNPTGPFPWGGGGTVMAGAFGQAAWGYLETAHPDEAVPYNYLAYVGLENFNLGGGAEVPNLIFLVDTALQDAPDGQNAKIYSVIDDALFNPVYGLGFPSGRLDACADYINYCDCLGFWVSPLAQDQSQASDLLGKLVEYTNSEYVQKSGKLSIVPYGDMPLSEEGNILTEGPTAVPAAPYTITVIQSAEFTADAGVTNAYTGAQFTRVSGKPKQSQYSVDSSGVYAFSAADHRAGTEVLIKYAISGTGATYAPPPPVDDLTDDDFILPQDGTDPVKITRKRPSDCYNATRVEFLDSALCVATYTIENQGVPQKEQVGQPYPPTIAYGFDQAAIETYGLRPESVQAAHFFTSSSAAQMSAQLRLQRIQARNSYRFALGPKWIKLDLMDVVTLTESITRLSRQMVRIKEINENDDGTFDITAEDFRPGMGSAEAYNAAANGTTPNPIVAAPGSVSAPVIFEPPLVLSGQNNSLWIAVGSSSANWGGCQVWVSTDGTNYKHVGTITNASRYGATTADFPSGSDPDTADTLSVDLSESLGLLNGGSQADADSHNLLALVGSEVISFSACMLTSAYKYDLAAYIRRGLFGTAVVDHPSGTVFVRLDSNIYKGSFEIANLNKPIYFKFPSFNLFGQALEDISTVQEYSFTPAGTCPIMLEFPTGITDQSGKIIEVLNLVG